MDAAVLSELERLYERDGCLRPEAVVAAAAEADSALHGAFEWDDAAAAHQHRLWQARMLIRAAVVVLPDTTLPRHVYVHVEAASDGRYLRLADVIREPDLYRAALDELSRKVQGIQRSIDELAAAASDREQRRTAAKARRAAAQLAAAVGP